jgi:hypothetical protein
MIRSPEKSKRAKARSSEPELAELVGRLMQRESPARLLELYYLSLEPELLDIMRAIIAMSAQSRETLEAFLALAGNPESITANVDGNGRLTLTSSHVAEAVDLMTDTRSLVAPELAHSTH